MSDFLEILRTIVFFAVLFMIPYMFALLKMLTSELRDVVSELQEVIRVLKEIRDHDKGIKRKRVRVE